MKKDTVQINGLNIDVYSMNTVVVGSGAAGLNAADSLYSLGQEDVAIVTEGLKMGTSRNTGSDKQTYYKLSLEGSTPDSVISMAETLFNGDAMHGDIALVEAALSAKSFYKLVDIGVPFPHNQYGEYVGYKTDHDPSKRATSAGPLTSKFMTEQLEKQVIKKGIRIFDGFRVIGLLTDNTNGKKEKAAVGLVAINRNQLDNDNIGITLFNCTNIIYAVGGPASMYATSVYPESQMGASGIAFEAGVKGVNLTESQYGIASIKFRWNLSGTYQQVIPRYISTNVDGSDEKEFLNDYFSNTSDMLNAIFLKGYQWPFDPRKIENRQSSLIDILVYNETQIKGRRVFLDYTKNPIVGNFDFSLLNQEAYTYLKNSDALFGTPIQRLAKMNQPAIDLYKNNGIDLTKEYLEIAVCAQHNNGGLCANIWWESNVKHFFPVGEVCGTFGVYRPGGTALNSTQVGSYRAAQFINAQYDARPKQANTFLKIVEKQVLQKIQLALAIKEELGNESNVFTTRNALQKNMTKYGAHIRSLTGCKKAIEYTQNHLNAMIDNVQIKQIRELPEVFINLDICITQMMYLNAIKAYIEAGGKSRGSYLIYDEAGCLPVKDLTDDFRYSLEQDDALKTKVCEMELICSEKMMEYRAEWKAVRPIPKEDNWFETTWQAYRENKIIT